MMNLVVGKLSVDTLIYIVFFKRRSYVTYIRISTFAHYCLPFFVKMFSCKFEQCNKQLQYAYYDNGTINCQNDWLGITDKLMKEYKCDLSSLSIILGASNEKMMHQLKIHSFLHFCAIAQSIFVARVIGADELILNNTINRKKIECLFSNILYVRNYIDFTKVKSYGGFYTEQVNLRNFIMKICFYAVTFYLYKVVYFFKHIFRNDLFMEDLSPVIGIWVTREIEEGFVGDVSWIDNSIKAKDIHLFIDRPQFVDVEYNKTNCSKLSTVISSVRKKDSILLACLKDNFSTFTKALFLLLKSNNKLIEKITILFFISESLHVQSLLKSKGVVILYNQKVFEKIATTIACEMLDIVQISGTWSNTPRHHMIYSDSSDVIFTWSDMIRNNYIKSHTISKFYVNVSPPSIDIIEHCRSLSKKIIRDNNLYKKKILGVLAGYSDMFASKKQYNKCWDTIIDLASNNNIFLLVKPKNLDDFSKNYPLIYKKLRDLENREKCLILYTRKGRPSALTIGFIADLVVGFSIISSAVIEASISGTPGIHISFMCGTDKHDLYTYGKERYVFTELKKAKKEILEFFNNESLSRVKMSTKEYNYLIDPHNGEKPYLRAKYVRILYDFLVAGHSKDTAILKTNSEFKKIHGDEVVTCHQLSE